MSNASRETLLTALYLVLGLIASALAGYWIVGGVMFGNPYLLARYLVVGFSGSLIYAAFRLRGLGYALIMVILMFFGQIALSPPLRGSNVVNAALWAGPVGFAFTAAAFVFKSLKRVPVGRFLLMAVLVGLGYALGTTAFLFKSRIPLQLEPVLRQGLAGLRLGGIMGIGIELVDLISRLMPRHGEIRCEPRT